MKCDDFKDKCGDLSDGEVSAEMRMHMAHCEECAAYYRLMRSLEPKAVPVAPGTLKREVLARAAAKHRKRPAPAGIPEQYRQDMVRKVRFKVDTAETLCRHRTNLHLHHHIFHPIHPAQRTVQLCR